MFDVMVSYKFTALNKKINRVGIDFSALLICFGNLLFVSRSLPSFAQHFIRNKLKSLGVNL